MAFDPYRKQREYVFNTDRHIIINAPAGTGKSVFIKSLVNLWERDNIPYEITAYTGVAALNINGSTFNSACAIGIANLEPEQYATNSKACSVFRRKRIFVIDEFSMLGARLFNLITNILECRNVMNYYGCRFIFVGDVMQIQPVNDEYIFNSEAFKNLNCVSINLGYNFRQATDKRYGDILNRIRVCTHTSKDIDYIEQRLIKHSHDESGIEPTRLYATNKDVDGYNTMMLNKLEGDVYLMKGRNISAHFMTVKNHEKLNALYPEYKLKVGAQVMHTVNDKERNLVNGSRGVVSRFDDGYPVVKFKGGQELIIAPHAFEVIVDDKVMSRNIVPLKLAWALTIHKCQSATMDSVRASLGSDVFGAGMIYVALTRVRRIEDITLRVFDSSRIKCDIEALNFNNMLLKTALVFEENEAENTNLLDITPE